MNKLVVDLLKSKPDDVLIYMRDWCNSQIDMREQGQVSESDAMLKTATQRDPQDSPRAGTQQNDKSPSKLGNYSDDECSEEDDEVAEFEHLEKKKAKGITKGARVSVSAESYGVFNQKRAYVPKVIEKSEEAKTRIRDRLSQAFMFAMLDEKEKNIVIGAMEECKFSEKDHVIDQGDDGEVLYVVDTGILSCYRRMKAEDTEDTFLKKYEPGEAFGELALLYNAPRAATIIADTESICFSLDRDCFNNIVKESAIKRRKRYEEFVQKIEILKELTTYERQKLTDCMQTETFKKDDIIIKQGDMGDKFYFVEEGTCIATKGEGESENTVFEYKENDYFGELALLHETPRAANIKVTSDYMLVGAIDRLAFKRLLGPMEELLKRNEGKYMMFEEKIKKEQEQHNN